MTGVTYRHPSVFAAQAMTIDHASHGRLELSLGAAWFDKEHNELGIPFPSTPERFDLLEDALEIVDAPVHRRGGLLRRARSCRCTTRSCGRRRCSSRTRRSGSAAAGPRRTLPLVARYADVWHAFGTPNSLREANARVDELAVEAGRDPAAILRAGSLSLDDLDTARKHAGKWRDAGYGYLVCGWPEAGDAQVERFAREVMPDFTG